MEFSELQFNIDIFDDSIHFCLQAFPAERREEKMNFLSTCQIFIIDSHAQHRIITAISW